MKKRHWMLIAMMTAAGTATFLLAFLRRLETAPVPLYSRPHGGEREGDFELFIGS